MEIGKDDWWEVQIRCKMKIVFRENTNCGKLNDERNSQIYSEAFLSKGRALIKGLEEEGVVQESAVEFMKCVL